MSVLKYGLAALVLCASVPAQAVELWHSDTVWAGQGMCAATFTFDSGGETVVNLRVALSAIDKAGNNIDSFILSVPEFGSSSADRYASELWESDVACDDEVKLVVTSATAVVNDERKDLLRNHGLNIRQFKPFQIQMAGQTGVTAEQAVQIPKHSLQCTITLDSAEAQSVWQSIQGNPKAYLQQCINYTSEMAIQFGGLSKKEAIRDATATCQKEITEVTACMARTNARAEECVCGTEG